jgi:hypothetical protein
MHATAIYGISEDAIAASAASFHAYPARACTGDTLPVAGGGAGHTDPATEAKHTNADYIRNIGLTTNTAVAGRRTRLRGSLQDRSDETPDARC